MAENTENKQFNKPKPVDYKLAYPVVIAGKETDTLTLSPVDYDQAAEVVGFLEIIITKDGDFRLGGADNIIKEGTRLVANVTPNERKSLPVADMFGIARHVVNFCGVTDLIGKLV